MTLRLHFHGGTANPVGPGFFGFYNVSTALALGAIGTIDNGGGLPANWSAGGTHTAGSTAAAYYTIAATQTDRCYQLSYSIYYDGAVAAGSVLLAVGSAAMAAVNGAMSGNASYEATTHTFNFQAPASTTQIRVTPTSAFNGRVVLNSCLEIVSSIAYATPTPKAHQLFSWDNVTVNYMWQIDVANFADISSPTVTATGPISTNGTTAMENRSVTLTSISNASPAIATKTNHGFVNDDIIELTNNANDLPAGLSTNTNYYVKKIDANTFNFSTTPVASATLVNTTSAGSGTHLATKYGSTYSMTDTRAYDQADVVLVNAHAGMNIRGVRHNYLHPAYNTTASMYATGHRLGGFSGWIGQFNRAGDVKVEGMFSDMNLDTHHGRFDDIGFPVTVTISAANPGVVTLNGHALPVNAPVYFTTTGVLPSGLAINTVYYLLTVLTANTFTVSATPGGTAIDTSGGGASGVHTLNLVVTMTIANPCVVTLSARTNSKNVNIGQPVVFSNISGALPTGVSAATTYYILSQPTSSTFTFGLSAVPGTTPVASSGSQSGTHSITIATTANSGPLAIEASPTDQTVKCFIGNVWARNSCDSIVDSKHANARVMNITYDMSGGGYVVDRGLMCHEYSFNRTGTFTRGASQDGTGTGTFVTVTSTAHGLTAGLSITFDFTGINDGTFTIDTVPDANTFTLTHNNSGHDSGTVTFTNAVDLTGKGFMGVNGFVCPDLFALDGFSIPFRMVDKRCTFSVFNSFINDEKVVSRAHALARTYLIIEDSATYGAVTDTEFAVTSLPPSDLPSWAYWPVLAAKLQVRKDGTSPWFDVPIGYQAGPFPAGAMYGSFDATAIAGAGIAAGNTINVRFGHYDNINHAWIYAAADGVAAYTTMTLGAGIGVEKQTILAAGTTLTGVSGANWTLTGSPVGYTHATGSSAVLAESSAFAPTTAKTYLAVMTIATFADTTKNVKVKFNGGTTQTGDNHTNSGTFKDELVANANTATQVVPASTMVCTGLKLSVKQISYMGDAT